MLMEWEDQAQILLLCGYRAHSREQGGERSAHGVPSSHFKVKKTIKMVIFSITLAVTLLFFFFFLFLGFGKEIGRVCLFSIGMTVYWTSGEIDIFPKHS